MSARRTTVAAVVALLVAVAVVLLGSPSQADQQRLLVSTSADGPFRPTLASSLFAGSGRLVPLERTDTTFFVKNGSDVLVRPTVAVVDRGAGSTFRDALTVAVDLDGTTSTGGVPSPENPGCDLVATGPSLAPGEVQLVDVSLTVGDLTDQVGMGQAASLDVVVTLTQVGPRGLVDVCGEQAVADPEVQGEQGSAGGSDGSVTAGPGGPDCDRDVVVTVAGSPTCVPTEVDAGATYGGGEPRGAGEIALLAGLLVATGAGMVVWAARRRRTD